MDSACTSSVCIFWTERGVHALVSLDQSLAFELRGHNGG
jgi:hypothetical protein